ncbi:MAG: NTP transferase domain-containing protein [Candidatus Limnocylindrales bacterium]
MTVAAVILFRDMAGALADAAGRVAVRRAVESAWAGGATPIVVVCLDSDGAVAAALAGSPAILAEPAPVEAGPVGQMARGMSVAASSVTETEGALIWPGRMAWVDAETVTTLIEASGARRGSVLRPSYLGEVGWPALVPIEHVAALVALGPDLMPDALMEQLFATVASSAAIDTGDPGVVYDISTSMDALPEFEGPATPVAGHAPEWGAAAAEMPDDVPLEGPSLAPYSQAAEEGN